MSIDDNLRRVCNQAFFERIWITDDDTIDTNPNPGFATVLHPGVQQAALRADRPGDAYDLTAFEVCHGFERYPLGGPYETKFQPCPMS